MCSPACFPFLGEQSDFHTCVAHMGSTRLRHEVFSKAEARVLLVLKLEFFTNAEAEARVYLGLKPRE